MKRPLLPVLLAALALLCACAAPAPSDPAPEPAQPAADAPQQYTLSFVGDCTLASSQFHRGSPYSFRAVIGDELARPFAGTAAYFQADSLTVANLECTLTDSTAAPRGLFGFAADPAYAGVLTTGGVDMVTLANNHSGDFGPDAYAQTGRTLDAAGIAWAGENEWTLVTTADGLTVGLYCTGASLSPAIEPCLAALEDMRAAGAELCVVLPHWGKEGSYRPNAAQRAFAAVLPLNTSSLPTLLLRNRVSIQHILRFFYTFPQHLTFTAAKAKRRSKARSHFSPKLLS